MLIRDVQIKGRLLLAPMCEVSNLPFRLLCRRFGASLVYTEMINCDAYIMESKSTKKRAYFLDEERPLGVQIFGSSVQKLKKAAKKIENELKPDLIDINIGCPAYNVMKTGSGSALLKEPERLAEIVKGLSSVLSIPLTCKIRILADEKSTIGIAKLIEEAGAAALAVHGRTARQGYSGRADWSIVKKIKKELNIPVILNGDILDGKSAEQGLKTGADALMIGRAAIGNPRIFKHISTYLKTGREQPVSSLKQRIEDFFMLLELCEKYGYKNLKSIKMQAQYFTKGYEGGKILRRKITQAKSIKEIKDILT